MRIEELLTIEDVSEYLPVDQVNFIGYLVDYAMDNSDPKVLEQAFKFIDQVDIDKLPAGEETRFNYNIANAWMMHRTLNRRGTSSDWHFQMEEIFKEIYHLRKALNSEGFEEVVIEKQCQTLTNLGNVHSYIGRFVEAQEYWNAAIGRIPQFAMAHGNKGNGLIHYAKSLYDPVHQHIFLGFAYHDLEEALNLSKYLEGESNILFKNQKEFIESRINPKYKSKRPDINRFHLGFSSLRSYRKWCLKHTLYLNPLNDLGPHTDASHDVLNLPEIVLTFDEAPAPISLFNQIKQEYGAARFAYFSYLERKGTHFSDTDVKLMETNEGFIYSTWHEQLKMSFRLTYSIFDKIAHFLAYYLSIEVKRVNFRNIWYSKGEKLRKQFQDSDNWPLRGLYWLSKDLFEKDDAFKAVLDPESKEIADIRNYIEHKSFQIVSNDCAIDLPNYNYEDGHTCKIHEREFEKKALKLLKLSRAAIIYLSLAVHHEEKRRDDSDKRRLNVPPRDISDYFRM